MTYWIKKPSTGSHTCFCSQVSALTNCDSLYLSVCLPNLGYSILYYDPISPVDLRRVVDFSGRLAFYSCWDRVTTFKYFTSWTGNQKVWFMYWKLCFGVKHIEGYYAHLITRLVY